MERHWIVFIESLPASLMAAAWAVTACEPRDLIELVAPWRRGQTEVDPATGAIVDAPTAARLRLLTAMDRIRAQQPEARLSLSPRPGTPVELLAEVSADADLVVLGGRPHRRFFDNAAGRSKELLRQASCPLVVVRPGRDNRPEALLAGAQGLRQEAGFEEVRRLARP